MTCLGRNFSCLEVTNLFYCIVLSVTVPCKPAAQRLVAFLITRLDNSTEHIFPRHHIRFPITCIFECRKIARSMFDMCAQLIPLRQKLPLFYKLIYLPWSPNLFKRRSHLKNNESFVRELLAYRHNLALVYTSWILNLRRH